MNVMLTIDKYLGEGKATSFDVDKLQYFSKDTILKMINSGEFMNKRVKFDRGQVGGTQKDTRAFIKALIKQDKEDTAELGFAFTKKQKQDYKYLRSI